MWCLQSEPSAEFVCAMEDVLEVYQRPYDPKRPQVCMDETSKQLIGETRIPIPASPGQVQRYDHEYRRNGVANLFVFTEPLTGRCEVKITERRTKADWAKWIKELVDSHYAQAQQIVLVMDNLNTHVKASLYEVFAPEEAKRLADKLEIHYTPKHGSWLNVAEIMLSVLGSQCLNRRIADSQTLGHEAQAWMRRRHRNAPPVNWRFTTEQARIKLRRLYPPLQP
jgi:transposase